MGHECLNLKFGTHADYSLLKIAKIIQTDKQKACPKFLEILITFAKWLPAFKEFYGDLVYKFKKIMGRTDFSDQFRKIIIRHKCISYDLNVMLQTECLVINPITVDNFAAVINRTQVNWASDSLMAQPKAIQFSLVGIGAPSNSLLTIPRR